MMVIVVRFEYDQIILVQACVLRGRLGKKDRHVPYADYSMPGIQSY